ncbi:MAG: hypothetical protein P8L16_03690, partial [Ilumatobacter sp.]|nr:hypothetical protein [Ilumatobacter sp.]
FLPDGDVFWQATDNQIRENVFTGNGIDIVMVQQAEGDGLGNCFADNDYETSRPTDIETVLPCDGPQGDLSDMIGIEFFAPPAADENVPYQDVASPGAADQMGMADPLTAPPITADVISEFDTFDLDAITVPTGG